MKAYPDPDPPAVAPIDPHAADAAVEKTRFDQDTARRAEITRSAQEAPSVQIRRQFYQKYAWMSTCKVARATRKYYSRRLMKFCAKTIVNSNSLQNRRFCQGRS